MAGVVINRCYGGFSLSNEAIKLYMEKMGWTPEWYQSPKYSFDKGWRCKENENFYGRDIDRNDPVLIEVVKELGEDRASGECAKLSIEDLPDGTPYRIEEYDGMETLHTLDNIEWSVA